MGRHIYSERYKEEVAKYGKTDTIIALCAYIVVMLLALAISAIWENVEITGILSQISQLALPIIVTGMVFAIVLLKKQGLASIGIHKRKIGLSAGIGLLFGLIPLVFAVLPGVFSGWEPYAAHQMLLPLLITFILAAWEDIFFVGYLQTRLYGLIKNSKLAICVGAALFAFLHVPVGLMAWGLGFVGIDLILYLAFTFIMHITFVSIFRRYFSLVPVVILHTIFNFSAWHIWRIAEAEAMTAWMGIASIVLLAAAGIFVLVCSRRARKD
jgi:membrane protease YdiL (CAAX protease family)